MSLPPDRVRLPAGPLWVSPLAGGFGPWGLPPGLWREMGEGIGAAARGGRRRPRRYSRRRRTLTDRRDTPPCPRRRSPAGGSARRACESGNEATPGLSSGGGCALLPSKRALAAGQGKEKAPWANTGLRRRVLGLSRYPRSPPSDHRIPQHPFAVKPASEEPKRKRRR